jgi:shikimate dehydrogenase
MKSSSHPRLAVIGDPISHSLSPVLQNFLIARFALPFTYEAVRVAPADLPAFVQKMRAGEFAGANVTIPHKQAVIPLLDDLSSSAHQVGAANTLVPEAGLLIGHNTDVSGLLQAARAAALDFKNQDVLLLGAGGAARAVLEVLCEAEASTIYICNRDRVHAEKLRHALSPHARENVRVLAWEDRESWLHLRPVTMIVNATSAGMPPQQNAAPLPGAMLYENLTVIDLIYNPLETVLLREAKKAGAQTLNGLAMLIYQGVAALELWSKQKLEIGEMYAEIESLLIAKISGG